MRPNLLSCSVLLRLELYVHGDRQSACIPFSTNSGRMWILHGSNVLAKRCAIAKRVREMHERNKEQDPNAAVPLLFKSKATLNPDEPDFELMQQLSDASIGATCPMSGMPIFNPAFADADGKKCIWKAYCAIASAVENKGTVEKEQFGSEDFLKTLEGLKACSKIAENDAR